MKAFIYRNLHKEGYTYSIRAVDGPHKGRVVGYASQLRVLRPTFHVSESGRKQVCLTGRKNVHAGVIGEVASVFGYAERLPNDLVTSPYQLPVRATEITYNPHLYESFVIKTSCIPIYSAVECYINGRSLVIV